MDFSRSFHRIQHYIQFSIIYGMSKWRQTYIAMIVKAPGGIPERHERIQSPTRSRCSHDLDAASSPLQPTILILAASVSHF